MLTELTIRNFRCFREVRVPLRPLTVLIGPNDAGKSAFLAAVDYVAQGRHLSDLDDVWRRSKSSTPSEIIASGKFGVIRTYRGRDADEDPRGARQAINPVATFLLPSGGLNLVCEGYPDLGEPPALGSGGEVLAAFLDHLLRRHRDRYDALVEALKNRVPGLQDIKLATPGKEKRQVDLVLDGDLLLPFQRISVGVRMLLFFVALTFHPSPPRIILIEEPENALHPKRLGDVVALLRDITQGVHCGHPAQVILTTHSPYLLDHIDLATDQVLVFKREADGSRSVNPVDHERLKFFMHESMLGEVWSLEGEDGLVRQAHA